MTQKPPGENKNKIYVEGATHSTNIQGIPGALLRALKEYFQYERQCENGKMRFRLRNRITIEEIFRKQETARFEIPGAMLLPIKRKLEICTAEMLITTEPPYTEAKVHTYGRVWDETPMLTIPIGNDPQNTTSTVLHKRKRYPLQRIDTSFLENGRTTDPVDTNGRPRRMSFPAPLDYWRPSGNEDSSESEDEDNPWKTATLDVARVMGKIKKFNMKYWKTPGKEIVFSLGSMPTIRTSYKNTKAPYISVRGVTHYKGELGRKGYQFRIKTIYPYTDFLLTIYRNAPTKMEAARISISEYIDSEGDKTAEPDMNNPTAIMMSGTHKGKVFLKMDEEGADQLLWGADDDILNDRPTELIEKKKNATKKTNKKY